MNKDKDRLVNLLTSSNVPHSIPADAIVIIDAIRTPVTKAKRGGLNDLKADELLSVVLKVYKHRSIFALVIKKDILQFNPYTHLYLENNQMVRY